MRITAAIWSARSTWGTGSRRSRSPHPIGRKPSSSATSGSVRGVWERRSKLREAGRNFRERRRPPRRFPRYGRSPLRLSHTRVARRDTARSGDRSASLSDLPKHELRLRLDGARGRAVRASHLREHLYAHREPDGLGLRREDREPRGRPRGPGDVERPRRPAHHRPLARPKRRSSRRLRQPLRRDGDPVHRDAQADGDRLHVGRGRRGSRHGGRDPSEYQGALYRDDRESGREYRRLTRPRRSRPRARDPVDRRQHVRLSVSLPPDRARCRHRGPLGGVIVESGKFPWAAGKHPLLSSPSPGYHDMNFAETFGEYAFLMRARVEVLRDVGAALAPMNAFLLIQGVETLPLRMKQHVENAMAIAAYLKEHPAVAWVSYAGLPDNPYYERALRYLPNGAGSIFTFGLRGGREAGRVFIESLELWSHLANVGDAKSLVIHPATTTHQQLSDADMVAAGISPEMIRLSVGLEDVEDLIWDLDRALEKASAVGVASAAR